MDALHVLHLEDDATDAFFIRQTLEQNGLASEIVRTSCADEFLKLVASATPDVILMDHGSPHTTGSQTLQQARARCPQTPIIILSRTDNELEIDEDLHAGADEFVPKSHLWQLPRVIRRLRDVHERELRARQMETHARGMIELVEVVQKLSLSRSMEEIMAIVRHAARHITGADGATFVLLEKDMCYYADEDAIQPLWKGQRFPASNCIIGHVAIERAPIVIEDIYKDPRVPLEFYKPTFVKSMAVVPIRPSAPIGGIGNYWAQHHRPTEQEIELLQALANVTAVAIENIQLYADLEQRVKDRTRQLQNANKELEAFAYSVSHDLRAPLSGIKGYADLLALELSATSAETPRQYLGCIRSEVQRMNGLIEDMLRLSKFTRVELRREPIDLAEMARSFITRLTPRWPDHLVDFRCPPHLSTNADASLLRIVLDNLLSNAWKYTSKRHGAKVELDTLTIAGKAPIYFIRDNGAGFEMERAQDLFVPFKRLHTAEDFPGTGVGLATTFRIIQRHGGNIWAEAEPGQGATFFFTLEPDPAPSH